MGAVTVKVDAAGQAVIPKEIGEKFGMPDGGELRSAAFLRLQRKLAPLARAEGRTSAVDELIAGRRAEAAREEADERAWEKTRSRRRGVSGGFVFDTSALLSPLLDEPGGDVVLPVLLSAVNLAEAIGILHRRLDLPPDEARADVLSPGLEAGSLEPLRRNRGIAFGDWACLTLGRVRPVPVLTAHWPWAALDFGVEARPIR